MYWDNINIRQGSMIQTIRINNFNSYEILWIEQKNQKLVDYNEKS